MDPDGRFEEVEPAVPLIHRVPVGFEHLAEVFGLEPVAVATDLEFGFRAEFDGGVDHDPPSFGREGGDVGPRSRKVEPGRRRSPN